jgi:tRNA(fMet)-specific endonuclease VapC
MILLDTNICIYIINTKPTSVLARFRQQLAGSIGMCSVVAAELAFGVAKSNSARNRQALEMFLAPITILPFGAEASWVYGDLRADLERRGTSIGSLDTMIAAHALSLQAMLVTNNIREFSKVPGLQLDNWVAPT